METSSSANPSQAKNGIWRVYVWHCDRFTGGLPSPEGKGINSYFQSAVYWNREDVWEDFFNHCCFSGSQINLAKCLNF